MKHFILFSFLLIACSSLILYNNCSPKERDHANPIDPSYINPNGDGNGNGNGNGNGDGPTVANLGIYSETHEGAPGVNIEIFIWNDEGSGQPTLTMAPFGTAPDEGVECFQCVAANSAGGWFGFGFNAGEIDMSFYSSGTIHVSVKSSDCSDIQIGVLDALGNGAWVNATTYTFSNDGTWHKLSIPVSDISGAIDISRASDLIAFLNVLAPTDGDTYYIDNIYWNKD